METKRVRVRRYFPDYLTVHDFQWRFTSDEFEAFKDFYETDLTNGEDPFEFTILDPTDSSQLATYEFGFFEAGYQFSYNNGVYTVAATVVLETTTVEQLAEPEPVDLCAVVIWPAVSDGLGGGTTFDCYDDGNYSQTTFDLAGTNISAILHGPGLYGWYGGEDYDVFVDGDLFVGSPSTGSMLVLMYYGDSPFGYKVGQDFDAEDVGSYTDGAQETETNLLYSFSGDGP